MAGLTGEPSRRPGQTGRRSAYHPPLQKGLIKRPHTVFVDCPYSETHEARPERVVPLVFPETLPTRSGRTEGPLHRGYDTVRIRRIRIGRCRVVTGSANSSTCQPRSRIHPSNISPVGRPGSPSRTEPPGATWAAPERLEKVPLAALVEDVGPDDQVEPTAEPVGLPVEPARPRPRAPRVKRQTVQPCEEQCRCLQVGERHVGPHRGGDRAGQAHPAAEVEGGNAGEGESGRGGEGGRSAPDGVLVWSPPLPGSPSPPLVKN